MAELPPFSHKILEFKGVNRGGVILNELFVQGIFVVPSLLCRLDEACFHEDLDVMADRRLGEVNNILDIRAMTATTFIGDVLEDPQTVRITERF